MDRLGRTTGWGLMLSVLLSVAVVAYRNDLSSRHGCVWSTMEKEQQQTMASSTSSPSNSGLLNNPLPIVPHKHAGGGFSLNCNLRTLGNDNWNYTNREQIEKTWVVRIKCSDKLFFESTLSPNQTFFQLRNLKEVQIESCKIRKLPASVFSRLTKLKSLSIRTQNTEWRSSSVGLQVEEGAFEGLGLVESLDLSQNNIWTFSENRNALCPLKSLVNFNVSHNRISDIDELISGGGSESGYCTWNVLQNVDLSHNFLRRLGQDAFFRMKRVTELRLQNNLIGELEDTAFEGLNQLKLLNLSSNRLVALPPFIFKSNVDLRELYLSNNTISALSSQVFAKMSQLLLLDLSKNSLTSQWVKDDMFQGLIRLVVLKLSHNQLSYLDSHLFSDLISLQALHLSHNRIETINTDAFQSLSNLHILDLSSNRISYVDGKMLSNLFVLRQLYLDQNKIRKIHDDALKNCSSIQDLGLVGNALEEVPLAFQSASMGQLKTLDIGENKIAFVSNLSFAGMGQIIGLRMVDNRLEELPSGFCTSMKKLRVLNLSQNKIKKVGPSAFTGCPELRVLRFDANSLDHLPPTLAPQLPSILWLNVSENRLTWVDTTLLPPSIEWLDLSYNSIVSLSGPPGPLSLPSNGKSQNTTTTLIRSTKPSHLRVMDVSYNKLQHLDQTDLPSSLENLRLNHNELRSIAPKTFILSTQLRKVELIGNRIESLSLESLQLPPIAPGRSLPEFYLRDNPFRCNCELEWLTRVNQLSLSRQQPRIVDLDGVVCSTAFSRSTSISTSVGAPGNAVMPLVDMRPRDFLCPYKSHCFALCHCCDFEACDCQMSCPDNCTCYHDNSWSSNIVECSNLQYENIPHRIPMDATEIYLDGNRIFQLGSHIFIGKKNLKTLYLNGSHVEQIKNKTFNGLRSLEVLRLEDNLLSELHGYEFADLDNLRELYLQNNLLRYIEQNSFANLNFLQVLRLDGNNLVDYSVWELSLNTYLNSVMLSNNPWSCECEFLNPFRSWVSSKTTIVVDFHLAKCQMHHVGETDVIIASKDQPTTTISSMCNSPPNGDITFNYEQITGSGNNEIEINNHISSMGGSAEKVAGPPGPLPPTSSENHLNFSRLDTNSADNTVWTLLLCLCAFLIVILVILGIFRQEIYYWANSVLLGESESSSGCSRFCSNLLNWLCCCPGKYSGSHRPGKNSSSGGGSGDGSDDQEKLFDAYFLYSKKDEDMLIQKVIPELEDPTTASTTPGHKFRLCLHYRDLCLSPESPWNREMILSACDASKRVVIVLSKTFLQSEWSSSTHFRSSIQSAIALHPKKLIFILLPDFDQSVSSISSELSNNSIKNSCVAWADRNFWSKFKRLLPTPSPIPPTLLGGEGNHPQNPTHSSLHLQNDLYSCDPSQLPYNHLIINPNLVHLQQLQQQHQQQAQHVQTLLRNNYHQNIIPYQIPMPNNRNNSLPPVPKHQILLPALPTNSSNSNHNGLLNLQLQQQPQYYGHDNTINNSHNHNNSLIHPIPSQLTPQAFGYSNETFHLQPSHPQSNHHHQGFAPNHHHPPNNHNQQPIHFSSSQQNPHQAHHHPTRMMPPRVHSHSHSHTPSQLSNFSSAAPTPAVAYHPGHQPQPQYQPGMSDAQNYSSSAVSSCAEFDHVYSTLDSPLQSPALNSEDVVDFSPNGGGSVMGGGVSRNSSSKHTAQHSTSSGVSSGSDMTTGGESSSAVSPSSPIKNGIISKLNPAVSGTHNNNNHMNANNNPGGTAVSNQQNNGKMYFV